MTAEEENRLKIACAEEMKRCLEEQKKRYPLMNEDDVVKFAFQGMLGVGHLIDAMRPGYTSAEKIRRAGTCAVFGDCPEMGSESEAD